MAPDPALSRSLIAGRFAVDASTVMAEAGGGLPAYVARDRRAGDTNRVALLVSRDASPRYNTLKAFTDPIDNLMTPMGHGVAQAPGGKGEALYVICNAPPGPPLSAGLRPWPERALMDHVLRPVARVLDAMQALELTHRGIRANNVFQTAPGQPVTLGAAWSAPPAMHQTAVFETPYQAMCHPSARGNGSIKDDVYALGVLLLVLAGGRVPYVHDDERALIRAKLEHGSFNVLSREVPLPGYLADLIRGMVADEPDHRPLPKLLLDPNAARARRVAARPARRGPRPLVVNDVPVSDAHTLAFILASDERKAVQALRSGVITTWLRRGPGEAAMASAIEEMARERTTAARNGPQSDAILVMRCINVLNSRMPLCWRGVALAPDGVDGLFAAGITAESDLQSLATEIIANDIVGAWSSAQAAAGRPGGTGFNREAAHRRRLLKGNAQIGPLYYFYALNPLLPCRLPAMSALWALNVVDVMRFLEKTAESAPGTLIDSHLAAFIAARTDGQAETDVLALIGRTDPDAHRLGELGLLKHLQSRLYPHPLPALAKWAVARLRPDIEAWRNVPKRSAIAGRMDGLIQAGFLQPVLDLVLDAAGKKSDEAEARRAAANLEAIDRQLVAIDAHEGIRFANAEESGHAIAAAIGIVAVILVVISILVK
jgi:hypothetical protein